ncbi:glucose 1-dehydrogenase [Bacillus massiliglaciei]|uniref:glucose 1-dehydrogenase n=1 Tax=Bacillus massiliglaciei TaxID=1816693 RepID=UPI000AAEA5CD|nr:glucose 1-dehydrogenase [Bacillus massiliglaciei]
MIHSSLFDLTNKTAIITGGGRGLGQQITLALAEAGANVVIASRNIKAYEDSIIEQLEDLGAGYLTIECDISKKRDIEEAVSAAVDQFGTIDILVNNSGTSWTASIEDTPEDKWDKVFGVNVKGPFLFTQAVLPYMKKQKSGKIINISSIMAFGGTPPEVLDTVAYNTSKGALITLTKDLAVKLARYGIQANAIAPGLFPSKITQNVLGASAARILQKVPLARFGDEEDLKGAALLLASKASDYITGQTLIVDGGLTAVV